MFCEFLHDFPGRISYFLHQIIEKQNWIRENYRFFVTYNSLNREPNSINERKLAPSLYITSVCYMYEYLSGCIFRPIFRIWSSIRRRNFSHRSHWYLWKQTVIQNPIVKQITTWQHYCLHRLEGRTLHRWLKKPPLKNVSTYVDTISLFVCVCVCAYFSNVCTYWWLEMDKVSFAERLKWEK